MYSPGVGGNEKLFKRFWPNDRHGRHAEKLIFPSRFNRPTTLKVSMQHCVRKYYQNDTNYDPRLPLFYAKVKFGHLGFYMGKSENYVFFGKLQP